ncbi:MAG: heme biosynthesis HemY N-terminal domain-containing protein [Gammaproteobacteria bacterium]|nr:heme biosynthesis HemY N-terminal domain-containing protein [Gammaproteobacteria bacterium]
MKSLFIIALALLLGAGLIWAADFEPGFVLLQYGSWSLETSLIVFVFAFILLVVSAYVLLRSLVLLKQAPGRVSSWQKLQRSKRASEMLTRGLIALEEGRWAEAERILIRHVAYSDTPLLHYLAAARAAQKQNAPERRDNYLSLAHQTTAGSDIAVGVVQAELQLAADQKEQALATLQHLRDVAPKHPYVLQLLQQVYSDMYQWQDVQAVLPDLRKRNVLASSDVEALSLEAQVGQMSTALARKDWDAIHAIWQRAPAKVRHMEPLRTVYISSLIAQKEFATAAELIEDFMRKQWSDQLVYQYGLINMAEPLAALAKAEKWLKNRENNPWLLLTLGRLAKANKLWVKAEEYLTASVAHGARGESYQMLAEVLAAQGKHQQQSLAYQKGLALMLANNG